MGRSGRDRPFSRWWSALIVGMPLAWRALRTSTRVNPAAGYCDWGGGLMRAAPTFVVMFFLLTCHSRGTSSLSSS